jgi:hypothetical protein
MRGVYDKTERLLAEEYSPLERQNSHEEEDMDTQINGTIIPAQTNLNKSYYFSNT